MDIRIIIRIDVQIRSQVATISSLSQMLEVSERTVYYYLKYMKEDLQAPIEYNASKGTYRYLEDGGFRFLWSEK